MFLTHLQVSYQIWFGKDCFEVEGAWKPFYFFLSVSQAESVGYQWQANESPSILGLRFKLLI